MTYNYLTLSFDYSFPDATVKQFFKKKMCWKWTLIKMSTGARQLYKNGIFQGEF